MDESWGMRMGMLRHPRRRSTEEAATRRSMDAIRADDFADVFGGPPRSVLSRKFSGEFTRSSTSSSFYEEIFRIPEFFSRSKTSGGRSLPAFRIPAREEGFYSDVFGAEDGGRRSRERSRPNSKSKSNSSSVLCSEELSPLRRPVSGDDIALSLFASKLRPINVGSKWRLSRRKPEEAGRIKQGKSSYFPYNHHHPPSYLENLSMKTDHNNDNPRSCCYKYWRHVSSPVPETIVSLEPSSYRSAKISVDDCLGLNNSPSSPVSSLCQEPEANAGLQFNAANCAMQEDDDDNDDEVMSSYVIEINSDHREGNDEAVSIDEAIAWAKERFQAHCTFDRRQQLSAGGAEEGASRHDTEPQRDECELTQSFMEEEIKKWNTDEEIEHSDKDMKTKLLDEDIKLWSGGKETNIRLLLSTLHHILWTNSGWHAIPLTSLVETSHVKKAYQKARLCLHPDKLQQRGATLPQKYVAAKAFAILQDAWATFISENAFL